MSLVLRPRFKDSFCAACRTACSLTQAHCSVYCGPGALLGISLQARSSWPGFHLGSSCLGSFCCWSFWALRLPYPLICQIKTPRHARPRPLRCCVLVKTVRVCRVGALELTPNAGQPYLMRFNTARYEFASSITSRPRSLTQKPSQGAAAGVGITRTRRSVACLTCSVRRLSCSYCMYVSCVLYMIFATLHVDPTEALN